jgi:hypothetical protein
MHIVTALSTLLNNSIIKNKLRYDIDKMSSNLGYILAKQT